MHRYDYIKYCINLSNTALSHIMMFWRPGSTTPLSSMPSHAGLSTSSYLNMRSSFTSKCVVILKGNKCEFRTVYTAGVPHGERSIATFENVAVLLK